MLSGIVIPEMDRIEDFSLHDQFSLELILQAKPTRLYMAI
jgi:hypothetical protein